MKNIHILPTDKPSRLHFDGKLFLSPNYQDSKTINSIVEGRNICITSDEKIKEDWVYHTILKSVFKINLKEVSQEYLDEKKHILKVVLTTDQDLIAEGVQVIDDEFLEWFVKNPSCENVEVEKQMLCDYCGQEHCDNLRCRGYKDSVWYEIIIPKEEPNPCKNIVINDKATVDVPFHNKHIRFENLTPEQAGYLLQVSEFYQLSGTRRSAVVPQEEPKQKCFSLPDCNCKEPDFDVMKGLCKVCGNSIIHLGKKIKVTKQETVQQFIEQHGITEQQLIDGYKQGLELIFEAASKITKQETLEEAGKDYIENTMKFSFKFLETKTQANRMLKCVEFGAKWQAERMYSEEEVLNILQKVEVSKTSILQQGINGWFKQFKKK